MKELGDCMKNKYIKFYVSILCFVVGVSLLHAEPVTIMPLGDSITYDNNEDDLDDPRPVGERKAYRNHLGYMLSDANVSFDFVGSVVAGQDVEPSFDPDNEGHPGWSSYDIASDIYDFLEQNPAEIVLLHIGTNDYGTEIDGVEMILDSIDQFEINNNKPVRVVLALIINFQRPDRKIEIFNNNLYTMANDRIIKGDNIVLVDMEDKAGLTEDDYADGLHPNDSGYKKMATIWVDPIVSPRNDGLYMFPMALVEREYIDRVEVDGDTILFTTGIPDDGINF